MAELSKLTLLNYNASWKYLKPQLSDITNVDKTINEINSIKLSVRGKPVTDFMRRNYICAIMYQLINNPDVRDKYKSHMSEYKIKFQKDAEMQNGSERMREKLKDLTWNDVIKYKNNIIDSKSIPIENKILIRLYTELDCPVRNDFEKLRVFIDEPRPATFEGNCLMLTRNPIKKIPRKKVVINKTVKLSDDECGAAEFYPVRNIVWLTEFKTSKHKSTPDIIQSIPDQLANDIIHYCTERNAKTLFDATHYALSKRIIAMFYQVSKRRIGINVLRHLKIMDECKNTPLLLTRKQTANKMGHSVIMQELYRIRAGE
jgi:hypothetical protein